MFKGSNKLREFVESVLTIQAPVINMFGGGVVGFGSSSAGIQGSTSTAAEITLKLQHKVSEFKHAYVEGRPIEALVDEIEVLLKTEQVLGVITQAQLDKLIDQADTLMKERTDVSTN